MSYVLGGVTIKAPKSMTESNNTQTATVRTLSGAINRDLFGSNKRVWTCQFANMTQTDYNTINTQYQLYLSSGSTQTWAVSEPNYTISSTNVHLDLPQRGLSTPGADYISEFTLTLIEA